MDPLAIGSSPPRAQGALAAPRRDDDPTDAFPLVPPRTRQPVDASAQALADPLRPTAADGWSPDRIVAVRSRNEGGFAGSAVNFTLGGVDERPGQRLSTAQVDQLAPFYATQFGLDEGFVRRELAKVYLYVGGPSLGSQAMSIGHHVFVPDERALERILSPRGRRWLAHELAHTMQFVSYHGSSPQTYLADYFTSLVVGRNPVTPGLGRGPVVWGALFTGLRATGRTEADLNHAANDLGEKLKVSALPAAVTGIPVAIALGGAIGAARATTGRRLLGTGNAMGTGMAMVAAPALAGAGAALLEGSIGVGGATVLGGLAGGAITGGALLRSGAFRVGGSTASTAIGRAFGRWSAIGAAAGATLAGIGIGALAANASANTIRGGAAAADLLADIRHRDGDGCATCAVLDRLGLQDAVHDAHWLELDAEAAARTFTSGRWERPEPGDGPVEGRIPTGPSTLAGRIDQDIATRLDWGLKVPLIVGIPAAAGLGAGVLGVRTGTTLLRTLSAERSLREAIRESLELLGSSRRGVANSLGVGAALTVAPLVAGGLLGPVGYNLTGTDTGARLAGGAAAAVTSGALLPLLLRGRGGTLVATSGKVLAGMAVAGALGIAAAGVATQAQRPAQRAYETAGWQRTS